jgi:hypothetical protein
MQPSGDDDSGQQKGKHQPVRNAAIAQVSEGGYNQNDECRPPGKRVHVSGSFSLFGQGTFSLKQLSNQTGEGASLVNSYS